MSKSNSWGSTQRSSHSALKSVPKMGELRKVKKVINGEVYMLPEGCGSGTRQVIKKMHKKKRRQFFLQEIQWD